MSITEKSLQFIPMPKEAFEPVVLSSVPSEIQAMSEDTLQEKVLRVVAVMKWVLAQHEVCFSYSGGKDSSTILSLGLAAAAQLKAEGVPVKRFLILNSDTQVENPEVVGVVRAELSRIGEWIRSHDLPGHIRVTEPYILSQWSVTIIGGKTLISTPVTNNNCKIDYKKIPLTRAKSKFFGLKKVDKGEFVVGVTGVRFSESAARAGNMMKRAESPVDIVQTSAAQDVFIAPIAHWSTDDVMEFIGLASNHDVLPVEEQIPVELYSDFKDVWRIYKDAEGECSVGRGDQPSKGCGARHGCFVCSMVSTDKSMDAFLTQEDYVYMQPLARFREHLNNTLFDYSNRTWIGRTIKAGHIAYGPDAYSPEYVQNLLRYALTIDRDEMLEASSLGIKPRFQIVSLRALLAIDAVWSLQAYALPFTALAIYHDVYVKGIRFDIPITQKTIKAPMPPTRYIPVSDWDEDALDDFSGLRNAVLEMTEGGCTSKRDLEVKGQARQVMVADVGRMFDVHEESALMILDFELERLVARHAQAVATQRTNGFAFAGEGYKWYVAYGAITLAKSQVGEVDSILRRSAWRERNKLAGYNYDKAAADAMALDKPLPSELLAKSKPTEAAIQEANRLFKRLETRGQRIDMRSLYVDWAPDVEWRKMQSQGLCLQKLPSHCLHKGQRRYASNLLKGWAVHHFVKLGDLVAFLKENPDVARKVKQHRNPQERLGQLDFFTA